VLYSGARTVWRAARRSLSVLEGGAFFIARLLIVIIQLKVKKSIGQKEKVEKFFRACIMKWKRRYISIADERA
jgi:hypothetical protein